MAATRYCGDVKISIKLTPASWAPHGEQYACSISVKGKRRGTMMVGIPEHLSRAIDSPEAYDNTAHAALSFATNEEELGEKDWGISSYLDYTDSGYKIRRKK